MTTEVASLVLLAAALHAGWNTLIKIHGDRMIVMAVVTFFGSIFSALFIPFVEFPDSASWPFLVGAILIHTAYHIFLPIAYDHGDLGQVYPIARGSAPLLVTIGAMLTAGEQLAPMAVLGVVFLTFGVMALTFEGGGRVWHKPKSVLFALLTGVLIASYTVIGGLGVRQAGSVLGFAVWLTIANGSLTFLIVILWKGRKTFVLARSNLITGLFGGIMQVSAYWIIVWAISFAPMATVSALRETSVLFAALISTFFLKEGFGVWRFVSAGLISLGLVAMKMNKQ